MPVKSYKVFPDKYEKILLWVGLFIPVPMPSCKYTPDFVIMDWGFGTTIGITKIPLGIVIIIISWLVKII